MKVNCILFFLLVIGNSCSTSQKETVFINSADEVFVKICLNTTKQELQTIQDSLIKDKKIGFDFSKTTFSSDGKIDQLDFIVKGPEGYQGHIEADLYMSDEYHGFRRDYRKGAAKPFQCGNFDNLEE